MYGLSAAAFCAAIVGAEPSEQGSAPKLLTLERALALARERAPAIAAARARIDEARGRRAGAGALLSENPSLAAGVGPRFGGSRTSADVEIGISQTFTAGRSARIAHAEAGVALATAEAEDVERRALRDVAAAFLAALHADRVAEADRGAEGLAEELRASVERRRAAGDASGLDEALAQGAAARAKAERLRSESRGAEARGALSALLGEDVSRAALEGAGPAPDQALEGYLARAAARADLRALGAGAVEAEAALAAADAERWPSLSLGASWAREEDADIVLGTIGVGLPIFARGQGARAEVEAKLRGLSAAREAAERVIDAEVRAAFEAHARAKKAAEVLALEGLPRVEEAERLAMRAYAAGEIGLADLLLIRRETAETRRKHLETQHEAALARVELAARAGVMP